MNFFYSQLDSESSAPTPAHFEVPDNLFEEIPLKGSKKAYRCTFPECGKLFNFKSETTRHTLIHKQGRPHTCHYPDCNKTFKRIDALKNHLQLHEKVLPHMCEVPGCGKRFATKAAIRYHMIRHENQRVYTCDFPGCDKSFLTPSQLKQHQNAANVHNKKSSSAPKVPLIEIQVREEPVISKVQVVENKEMNEEFTELAPKLVEIMQWETKTLEPELGTLQSTSKSEVFDALYTYLLKENKILKTRMQERQKITELCEKKISAGAGFEFEDFQVPSQDFSMLLNTDELKFLEFLREQENNGL